jgi:hypothetical protein
MTLKKVMKAKRTPVTSKTQLDKLSKADLAHVREALRYYAWANVMKEFKGKREREAIAAVLEWLSLNSVCAWVCKDGRYSTVAWSKSIRRAADLKYDACVIDRAKFEETASSKSRRATKAAR